MSKTVRRLPLLEEYQVGEMESWLSDMAAKGLHLKKVGTYFAYFERGEPANIRYRMEYADNSMIDREWVVMYATGGWEYVAKRRYFHIFRAPEDSGAPELHTDPTVQAYTIEALSKKMTRYGVAVGLCIVFLLVLIFAGIGQTPFQYLNFVEGLGFNTFVIGILNCVSLFVSMRAMLLVRKLKVRLSQGQPIDHHANWRIKKKKSVIFLAVFTFLALLMAIIPGFQWAFYSGEPLSDSTPSILMRIKDIEGDHEQVAVQGAIQHGVDQDNCFTYGWSVLAPKQYELEEHCEIPGKQWDDGSGDVYSPWLSVKIDWLLLPFMRDSVVDALCDREKYYPEEVPVPYEHEAFDKLYVLVNEHSVKLFGYKGNMVVYVSYRGLADADTLCSKVGEKLAGAT